MCSTDLCRRCVICMIEFTVGDPVRYLPCMHTYHTECIDDWLMRSFTCPSCMEPVDAALLGTAHLTSVCSLLTVILFQWLMTRTSRGDGNHRVICDTRPGIFSPGRSSEYFHIVGWIRE